MCSLSSRVFLVLVVVVLLAAAARAGLARGPLFDKPDDLKDVPGCYLPDLGRVLAVGERAPAPVGNCEQYQCDGDYIEYYSCGSVLTAPPCVVVTDDTLQYPHCCPHIKCPTETKTLN